MARLKHVDRINLQFADGGAIEKEGFETVRRLKLDSRREARVEARRTPILTEICSLLAALAESRELPYFMIVSSDERVQQPAVDYVLEQQLDGYIFSRMDFNGETGRDEGVMVGGQGCWVFSLAWWREHGWRLRPYVFGESYFDNVTTSKLLCHGRARLLNRSGDYVRHENHPRVWPNSPFLPHTRYLASLDTLYLNLWYRYIGRLSEMRAAGASEAEEWALQAEIFRFQPGVSERLTQTGRSVKAWLRFQWQTLPWLLGRQSTRAKA